MKITTLCSSEEHPVNQWLKGWISKNQKTHQIDLIRKKSGLTDGDILFLISCSEIISKDDRKAYKKVLVIHASDLPSGRGWSPHIWQIIEGNEDIVLTLLEAEDDVDSGDIWHQVNITIPKYALYDEINSALFDAELTLMDYAVENFYNVQPCSQSQNSESTYYRKRLPSDSEIDPLLSISEQFNLIRVCDPERYPAFFKLQGKKYKIILEKMEND